MVREKFSMLFLSGYEKSKSGINFRGLKALPPDHFAGRVVWDSLIGESRKVTFSGGRIRLDSPNAGANTGAFFS